MAAAPPAVPDTLLVLRTKSECRIIKNPTENEGTLVASFPGDFSECPVSFCSNGALMAVATPDAVRVINLADGAVRAVVLETAIVHTAFVPAADDASPLLVTYRIATPSRPEGNLAVWRLPEGTEVMRMVQSKWPAFSWTHDGEVALRVVQGCIHVHKGDFSSTEPLAKLAIELPATKNAVISLAPTQPLCAVFVPHNKTAQASLRVSRLPTINEEMFQRVFGRADDATVMWNFNSSCLLVVARSHVDKSGASYYGSEQLHIVNVRDRQSVALSAELSEGGVHDCRWSPVADELIVVHGAMPLNKATLINSKGQKLYSFGESPRNVALWSPNGNLFALGGVGNLAGDFQFYDRKAFAAEKKASNDGRLGSFSEKNTTHFWSPCSRYLVAANVFSKLRTANKYTLWSHSGRRITEVKFDELHEAIFAPIAPSRFPERPLSPTVPVTPAAKPALYRPAHYSAAAAAMLARPTSAGSGTAPKPAGPVGATVVKEKRRK